MNKFILTTMAILTTVGCFAELPNMKKFPNTKNTNFRDQVSYCHKFDDKINLYRSGTFESSHFSGIDNLTKCLYSVYGILKGEDEPICQIEDKKGNVHVSDSYWICEKEDHTIYYFNFLATEKNSRFVVLNYDGDLTGYFQTFE